MFGPTGFVSDGKKKGVVDSPKVLLGVDGVGEDIEPGREAHEALGAAGIDEYELVDEEPKLAAELSLVAALQLLGALHAYAVDYEFQNARTQQEVHRAVVRQIGAFLKRSEG